MIQSYRDLEIYQLSFDAAMDIFNLSGAFPREEMYSLTNQIVRSSRSVAANVAEGWAKRHYENKFKQQLIDAMGSCTETEVWLDFALKCKYINASEHVLYTAKYISIGKMLTRLHQNWKTR